MSKDASMTGWGACIDGCSSGENWTSQEAKHDINYLEILAVLFALKSFHDGHEEQHINLMVDNTTAVATINQMDTGHSLANNTFAKEIWQWCDRHKVAYSHTYSWED